MKDPQDCTYPHTQLCLHNCKENCVKRSTGNRKKQIEDAEEEAWQELSAKQGMPPIYGKQA